MPSPFEDLANNLRETNFVHDLLNVYIRNGYGSLPKREIDILLLQLALKHSKEWAKSPPTTYELARLLRISPRRTQTILDEIAYRDAQKDEDWCRKELVDALKTAEKIKSNEWVQFQIDDSLVRDYAVSKIRTSHGIVDSSFNAAIIKLSGSKFAALAIEVLDQKAQSEVLAAISSAEKSKYQNKQKSKSSIRLFVDAFATKAGSTAGKKTVDLGFSLLTGGWSDIKDLIKAIISSDGDNE